MTAGAVQALVSAGKLKALAVTSGTRFAGQPAVPTVTEAGFPEFEVANSFGAFVPLGTPPQIVMELNSAFNRALQSPEVLKRLASQGYEPVGGTPQHHQAAMRSDMKRIEALISAGSLAFE
jgi:tripartite-type tricarboxylate transporter receptor subunit TctC